MTSKSPVAAKQTCMVCRYEIKDSGTPVKIGPRIFIVCCDECEKKIRENPTKFIHDK